MTEQETLWISRAKEGDHRAFRSLYDLHVAPLFRFLRQFANDTSEVEEWVQKAFIKAYEHLDSFDGRAQFSTWLTRLGLNEMKMDRRRSRAVRMVPLDRNEEGPAESEPDDFEWDETMKGWLRDLDETKRAVFILYEIEGYSHAEISELLNIGESTSRTLLSRSKQFLRNRWKDKERER
jgi:RNA polymerase sigma-70 factor (ECF subfamily)